MIDEEKVRALARAMFEAEWKQPWREVQWEHDEAFWMRIARAGLLHLALAGGAQSAETSETSAQSEGRQSGPKGNAQRPSESRST